MAVPERGAVLSCEGKSWALHPRLWFECGQVIKQWICHYHRFPNVCLDLQQSCQGVWKWHSSHLKSTGTALIGSQVSLKYEEVNMSSGTCIMSQEYAGRNTNW